MKVISGLYKGRSLKGFDIDGTRPTMDRVKESLFASIQNYIPNSISLDLFSGSGNLGIEALSMGGAKTYLVDHNSKSIQTIKYNVNNIGIDSSKVIITNSDFRDYLKTCDMKFDIIFLDPPYATSYINDSLELIVSNSLINKDGIIVCETDDISKIEKTPYKEIKNKKYGDKYIVILKNVI